MNKQESKKLEQNVQKILSSYLKEGDAIIAGISGGPDSMFLLQMLNKFSQKTSTVFSISVVARFITPSASKLA